MPRDRQTGPNGETLLTSRGFAKVLIVNARGDDEPARSNARKNIVRLCKVRDWDAVEALEQALGEGFVLDAIIAGVEARLHAA